MVELSQEFLDKLFVNDFDEFVEIAAKENRNNHDRLRMIRVIRKFAVDQQPSARIASKSSGVPLIILHPEPIRNNFRFDPDRVIDPNVLKWAYPITDQTHPGGAKWYFHCPYGLDDYLNGVQMVLSRRSITRREIVKFLANKMGAIHADKNLVNAKKEGQLDAETLALLNQQYILYGEPALFQQSDWIFELIGRACKPIREVLFERYGGNVSI